MRAGDDAPGRMNDPLLTRADEAQHENDPLRTERRSLLEECDRLRAEMRELISKRQTSAAQDPKSARPFTL